MKLKDIPGLFSSAPRLAPGATPRSLLDRPAVPRGADPSQKMAVIPARNQRYRNSVPGRLPAGAFSRAHGIGATTLSLGDGARHKQNVGCCSGRAFRLWWLISAIPERLIAKTPNVV